MSDRMTPGHELQVMHACPECTIGQTNPHCPLCRGAGLLPERAILGLMSPNDRLRAQLGL